MSKSLQIKSVRGTLTPCKLKCRSGQFVQQLFTPATKYIKASSPDAVNTAFAQILLTCLIAGLITNTWEARGQPLR